MPLPFRIAQVPRMFSEGIEDDPVPRSRSQKRAELFSESFRARGTRLANAFLEALGGAPVLLPLRDLVLRDWVVGTERLPDMQRARTNAEGYCGIAHDLSPATLIEAYERGLVPLAHLGPAAWYAPPHRLIADPAVIAASAELPLWYAEGGFTFTFDQDFERVLAYCAEPANQAERRTGGLAPRLLHAFVELFDAGHAHSFAVRDREGGLAGGGFGVAVGWCFLVHSRFERVERTAKAALVLLSRHLASWQFALVETRGADAEELGFRSVERIEFQRMLAANLAGRKPRQWTASGPLAH